MMPDDRRSLTTRLSVLQYLIAGAFAALAVGSGSSRSPSTRSSGRLPRTTISGGCRCRRPAACCSIGTAAFSSRTATSTTSRSCVNRRATSTPHCRVLAEAIGADGSSCAKRSRGAAASRATGPIVLVENATQEQVIAITARKWELPGIIYQEVPSRRYPGSDMAAHVFGYVGEVTEAQLQRADYQGVEPGTLVGQSGAEEAYNALLMGKEGTRTVVVNSVGREISVLPGGTQQPLEGRRLQLTIDADVQKAIEDAFRRLRLQRGGRRAGSPNDGAVLGFTSRPAFDPERLRRRNRSCDVGVAQYGSAAAAAGPRAPGALLARIGVQDGGRPRRARGRHHHARLQGVLRRRGGFLRALFQVLEAGRSRRDRPAPRHRAVLRRLLLHRRQHARASIASTSGPRCSAWA